MKKIIILAMAVLPAFSVVAQQDSTSSKGLNGILQKAGSIFNSSKTGSAGSLSSDEIIMGLKEALTVGAKNSTSKLSSVDGFLKDAAVKILIPEDVRKVETRLRALGMGKLVDQAITSINRAAEDASRQASPIFINAIKKMTVQDAVGILKGSDTAATAFLKNKTTADLTTAFMPVVESSLKKVNATKYWRDLTTIYNRVALTPVTSDLNEYVTANALKGIFYYVGEEEKKIRTNPAARITSILQKVFGNK
jgi:hypothetical protein